MLAGAIYGNSSQLVRDGEDRSHFWCPSCSLLVLEDPAVPILCCSPAWWASVPDPSAQQPRHKQAIGCAELGLCCAVGSWCRWLPQTAVRGHKGPEPLPSQQNQKGKCPEPHPSQAAAPPTTRKDQAAIRTSLWLEPLLSSHSGQAASRPGGCPGPDLPAQLLWSCQSGCYQKDNKWQVLVSMWREGNPGVPLVRM